MNLRELDNFKLGDAVNFHETLNPELFRDEQLRPEVRKQLLEIADDFLQHLGLDNLKVKDITLSGSNAAYTYTPHSDIDVHIIVDMGALPNDEVYRELFTAKKNAFNDTHDIKVHGYDVELYVQDTAQPVRSLGEYSLTNDRWIKFPSKNRANFDERATRLKFTKLVQLIELALHSKNLDLVQNLLDTLKRYRTAGLSEHGEFGPENLAYKALRTQGIVDQLFDLRDELHSKKLSLDEADEDDVMTYSRPSASDVRKLQRQYREYTGQSTASAKASNPWIWKKSKDIGISIADAELLNRGFKSSPSGNWGGTQRMWDRLLGKTLPEDYDPNERPPGPEFKPTMPAGTVRVDVSDVYDWYKLGQHISNMKGLGKHDFGKGPPSTIMSFGDEDLEHKYIDALAKTGLTTTDIDPPSHKKIKNQKVDPTYNVSEASGYIPSEREKNDPRFKTALTVDVHPNSIKKNAQKLGLGKIRRDGVPPTARADGKF